MTLDQILTDITAALGAIGLLCSLIAHLPISPKWAERFARFATYAANTKFSVNVRTAPPPPRVEPRKDDENTPPWGQSGALVMLFAIACALHAQGCATSQMGACDPLDGVRIAEKYRANMSLRCKGYKLADCPYRAELEAQHAKDLEAACSK